MDASLPTLEDWLSGQCHREDPVGMLARLALEQNDRVGKLGFAAWLEQLTAENEMASAVQQARDEFATCVAELTVSGHSPSYPSWQRDGIVDKVSDAAWARHQAEPNVSSDEYLHRCHKQLRRYLDGLTLPYLDTCHWIRLREVEMDDPRADSRYVPIWAKLRKLKTAGKILCPFSFLVFVELTKQQSDVTRRAMARLIDELAEGTCLQPPNVIEQVELKRQILHSVLGAEAPDLNEWIWTKAAWVCGELLPHATAFSAEDQNTIKKVFTDIFWNSRLLDLVEFLPAAPMPPYLEDLAEAFNQDAKTYRAQRPTFQQVLQQEKAHHVGGLVRNDLPRIALEVWQQFPVECAACATRKETQQKPDPGMLASVQIRAGVHASFFTSSPNMKFESNDLIDAQHAAVALPYCDLLFVDKPLAHRLNTKPLDFGRVYGKPITGDPAEFLSWLEKL